MSATQFTFLVTVTFEVYIRCWALFLLSTIFLFMLIRSSKIGDPDDGSFLRALGLHNSVLALHLQKN